MLVLMRPEIATTAEQLKLVQSENVMIEEPDAKLVLQATDFDGKLAPETGA